MICKLCNLREADKKGSHIIPDFILRSMLVDGDTSKRSDKIISNRIDVFGTDMFLGREINQDKVNELFGRDITEEERANNINHYTVDNIFCTKCEDRFSYLETIFKTEIYDTIKAIDTTDKKIELKDKNIQLFKLFWLSIIWRCSIVKFQTFAMNNKSNFKIQQILHNCLADSLNETRKIITANKNRIDSINIGVLFALKVDNYLSNLVFCNPFVQRPYTLVINDFYLFYYSKFRHIQSSKQSMYKLDNIFKSDDYVNFKDCKTIKIGLIPSDKFNESKSYIYNLKGSSFLNDITRLFSDTFVIFNGSLPSRMVIGEFVNDVVYNDNVNEFERYNMGRIIMKIRENIKKCVG